MPRTSKTKQDKTLEKMKEQRVNDSLFVRDCVQKKLDWAEKERKQGKEAVEAYEKKLEQLREQILRLEGSIIILREVLNAKPEIKNDSTSD